MKLLQSDLAKTVFVPTEWLGLKIDPVKITLKGDVLSEESDDGEVGNSSLISGGRGKGVGIS